MWRWILRFLLCPVALFPVALPGCFFQRDRVTLPTSQQLQRDQLVIHSDFELARHHRLLDELVARRTDMIELLELPVSDEPIQIYLFDSSKRFHAYMRTRHPDFPYRRAFFVETDTRLIVYAHWGDRVAEDLRHEVAHGYLHSMVPRVPLWLDEGLAEYFEVPRGRQGLNTSHLELLLDELPNHQWRPTMAALEQLQMPHEMTQLDYAEAWAWTHFLLQTTPQRRELLQNHLARIRMTGTAPPLSKTLQQQEPNADRFLVRHLLELSVLSP